MGSTVPATTAKTPVVLRDNDSGRGLRGGLLDTHLHNAHTSIMGTARMIAVALAGVTGAIAVFAAVASCSAAGGAPAPSALPPADAAVPWVGCYQCTTVITAQHIRDVDASAIEVETGLDISATGNTLIGAVVDFSFDSGHYDCEFAATVAAGGRAALDGPPDGGWTCPIYSTYGIIVASYSSGEFTLAEDAMSFQLAVSLGEFAGSGLVDAGSGTQSSQCSRISPDTCLSWR